MSRMSRVAQKGINATKFWIALMFAFAFDVLQLGLFPLFGQPGLGDLANIMMFGFLYSMIGPIAVISLSELLPLMDALPMYTIAVLGTLFLDDIKQGKQALIKYGFVKN